MTQQKRAKVTNTERQSTEDTARGKRGGKSKKTEPKGSSHKDGPKKGSKQRGAGTKGAKHKDAEAQDIKPQGPKTRTATKTIVLSSDNSISDLPEIKASKIDNAESDKLQKVLANNGVGSRREMERWIESGRISVNGIVAKLGDRVQIADQIRVDGHIISRAKEKSACRVLMYNKPEGELCSRNDPEGRATVFERLPKIDNERWIAVGRLDINTSGLLLFTNDGELANRLMHPRHEVEREYAVRIFGEVTPAMLRKLEVGVELEDGMAKFNSIQVRPAEEDSLNQWYNVTLSEGKNREVRRLWESQGVQVSRLMRVRYGALELQKRLPQGAWIELELERINQLRTLVQLDKELVTKIHEKQDKIGHSQLSRMRRSVKKHKQYKDGQRQRSAPASRNK